MNDLDLKRTLPKTKHIALVAHDLRKANLINWVSKYRDELSRHHLYATGTTGNLLSSTCDLAITNLMSGPMGGDQQLGALIAEKRIDMLIFFWDPLNAAPHDPDVKALLRIATLWNIPCAMNEATANLVIESEFLNNEVKVLQPDYETYIKKRVKVLNKELESAE